MKRLSTVLLGLSLFVGGILYADSSHGNEHKTKVQSSNNHMGDHMHEGKMINHMNKDGKTEKEMENNHMGDHMHEGKMTNHMNKDGKTDK